MLFIDALFRFSGISALILIAILTLRDNRAWQSTPYLVLACLSVSALFLGFAPEPLKPPMLIHYAARFLDVPHLVLVWLFALSLYQKNFRIGIFHWVTALIYCSPIIWIRFAEFGFVSGVSIKLIWVVTFFSIVLTAHLIFATLSDWADDLVEHRRRTRVYFVLTIIIATIIAAVSELWMVGRAETMKVLSIWPAIAIGAIWLLQSRTGSRLFGDMTVRPVLSKADADLREKLEKAMKKDKAHRDPDLSIVNLSSRLGVTQHRLRALINGALGYQNFSSYVNDLRIADMKSCLSDPDMSHLPIQTLAMDCGYRSLSPFNRAFRLSEGMTPSEFRRRQMSA